MGILFKNGTVVTSTAMYQADVRIQGEKITEVGQDLCIKDDQAEWMCPESIFFQEQSICILICRILLEEQFPVTANLLVQEQQPVAV